MARRTWRLFARWVAAGVLAGVAAGVAVAALSPGGLEWPWRGGARGPDAGAGQPILGETVQPTTELVFRWVGTACGEVIIERRPAGRDAIGATEADMPALYPGWVVGGFGADRVELSRVEDALCEELERYRLVTLKDDWIAVYHGRRPPLVKLKEITRVPATSLRQADLDRLTEGVVVEGDAGVVEFLEGLSD